MTLTRQTRESCSTATESVGTTRSRRTWRSTRISKRRWTLRRSACRPRYAALFERRRTLSNTVLSRTAFFVTIALSYENSEAEVYVTEKLYDENMYTRHTAWKKMDPMDWQPGFYELLQRSKEILINVCEQAVEVAALSSSFEVLNGSGGGGDARNEHDSL